MTSSVGCYILVVGCWGEGGSCHRRLPCTSLSVAVFSHQYHNKSSLLLITVSGRMEHGPPQGMRKPWIWPWAQTRPSEAAPILDINMASGGSLGHPHQHSPLLRHSLGTPIWPQAATQKNMDIQMAFSDDTGYGHQHRSWLQWDHGPRLIPQF